MLFWDFRPTIKGALTAVSAESHSLRMALNLLSYVERLERRPRLLSSPTSVKGLKMDQSYDRPGDRRTAIRLVVGFFAFIIAGSMIAAQFPA